MLKFGGTSVGTPGTLRQIVALVERAATTGDVVVVISAASGVTDNLLQAVDTVAAGTHTPDEWTRRLDERHTALAAAVLRDEARYRLFMHVHLEALRRTLDRIAAGGITQALRDEALATGERLSVPLLTAALHEQGLSAIATDATQLVRTDTRHGAAGVLLETTYAQIRHWYAALPEHTVPVVTGFIGATEDGAITTLGRSGSDYSAALLAAALHADVLERWTDVDGLYTDDPRRHATARRLDRLALDQAQTWNRAGRLGMHSTALEPLVEATIPLHVRSTRSPDAPGTWILPPEHFHARAC